jgi:hypothetical protein
MLKDHLELEVLENGMSKYRLVKTFKSAKTALRCAFVSTLCLIPHEHMNQAYDVPSWAPLTLCQFTHIESSPAR